MTVNPAAMVATRYHRQSPQAVPRSHAEARFALYLRTIYQSNIRGNSSWPCTSSLLTLSRKSELLLARWEACELGQRRMAHSGRERQDGKPHIVYMSTQVAEMFRELKALAGDSELVLPGRGSTTRPFATNALNKALEGLTFDMDPLTIHDLRRTGATLLTEHGFNKDVIEKALSHEHEGIRAVYIVAEYAEQRKKMLQWWADYVDGIC